jgi:hypothetical protein
MPNPGNHVESHNETVSQKAKNKTVIPTSKRQAMFQLLYTDLNTDNHSDTA